MEILKTLLANTFDKRIRRLENRTISQMNDLKFTKDCFANQGKMIDRLATIKFTKPKPKEHLKRDVSAGTLTSRTHRLRDNTPVTTHKEPNRQKTPVNVEKKNVARTGRSKSPIPSYMADTASNQVKKKKEIENIYTQIKRNKEKENGIENVSTTVTHKKVTRPLTPDGRTLQRRNRKKPIEKNTNNNNTHDDVNKIIKEQKEENKYKGIYVVENMPAEYLPSWQLLNEAAQQAIIRSAKMYDFTKEGVLESFWANIDFGKKAEETKPVVESKNPIENYQNSIIANMKRLRGMNA